MAPSSLNVCKVCGKANAPDAEFCAYCGGTLGAQARYRRLTPEEAAQWGLRMRGYEFYARLWTPGGAGTRNHYKCMLMQPVVGERAWPGLPFLILPILDRDWCLRLVEWEGRKTTAGELIFGTQGLALYDLAARQSWRISYARMNGCSLSIHWVLGLSLNDRTAVRLVVKRGGARISLYRSARELLESQNPEDALDRIDHPADERGWLRRPPRTWDDKKAYGEGSSFWTQVLLFLAQGVDQ